MENSISVALPYQKEERKTTDLRAIVLKTIMDDGIRNDSPHSPEQEAQRIKISTVMEKDESAPRKLPVKAVDFAQITVPLMQVSLRNA